MKNITSQKREELEPEKGGTGEKIIRTVRKCGMAHYHGRGQMKRAKAFIS